jgi:shikimate 5-dehydrogenase
MREHAESTRSHNLALRYAPAWVKRKIKRDEERADAARKCKADIKGLSVSMPHKELELQLAESEL